MNIFKPCYKIKVTERDGIKYYQPIKISGWPESMIGGFRIFHSKKYIDHDLGYKDEKIALDAIEEDKVRSGMYDKVSYKEV